MVNHVVVAYGPDDYWCPSLGAVPPEAALTGPALPDGYFWVEWIIRPPRQITGADIMTNEPDLDANAFEAAYRGYMNGMDSHTECLQSAIRAYLAASPSPAYMGGWLPIETAPRCVPSSEQDSGLRPVLVTRWPIDGHHKPVAVARLTVDGWIVGRGGKWRKSLWFEPTHWMSLDALGDPYPRTHEKIVLTATASISCQSRSRSSHAASSSTS